MSSSQPETSQSPKRHELASVLRAWAAQEKDPAEAQSLLAAANKVENADASAHRAIADLQASIEHVKSVVDESKRRNDLPLWFVVAVLVGFLVFLGVVAGR